MKAITAAVDKCRDLILETQNYIWKHPETGYREWKTSAYLSKIFENLGYELVQAGDIPGFYTVIDTGRSGPEVLILAELDSLICASHPDADSETGAAHVCGHCAQVAALVGIAAALTNPELLQPLSGRIRLCAVPAEELIELEFRKELREKGIIRYMGGKPEFLSRGYFDGVDVAFMVHTSASKMFSCNRGSVGCLAKKATYKGVSSHAGGSPWNGINALYAANLGLSGINAIRETFKESDIIRVHPIITHGGDVVSTIPDRVSLESFVRGRQFDAILEANKKVNQALCGGALALGANIEIEDFAGYAPLVNDPGLIKLAEEALHAVFPEAEFLYNDEIGSGSTDMADLSCIMPVIHPYAPGAVGRSHGDDFFIKDPDLACVASAKWQLSLLTKLLEQGGKKAMELSQNYESPFPSKEAYLSYVDAIFANGDRITYHADGSVTIK